jgi:hypothetical protein
MVREMIGETVAASGIGSSAGRIEEMSITERTGDTDG